MIQFSVQETSDQRSYAHDACVPIAGSLRRAGPWGDVIPVSVDDYITAARDAGVDPKFHYSDVQYCKTLSGYRFTFTFAEAETYPALYSRNLAALLAISLNPTEYGALHLLNDFPKLNVQMADGWDTTSRAREIVARIHSEIRQPRCANG